MQKMTSERGDVTDLSSPSSFQVVFIDIESLPTGMASPSCGHSSMPMASTACIVQRLHLGGLQPPASLPTILLLRSST